MKNEVEITAKSIDEFNKIEKIYNGLNSKIRENIYGISNQNFNVLFKIKQSFSEKPVIYVPEEIDRINIHKGGVTIHTKIGIFDYCYEIKNSISIET